MTPKLCIDCKHCTETESFGFSCTSPETKELGFSVVTGGYRPVNCNAARMSICGADGKFFEPKEIAP